MKANEIILEQFRVRTGVRNTTIPVEGRIIYQGPAEDYEFGRVQKQNYLKIRAALQRNGLDFSRITVGERLGGPAYNALKKYALKMNPEVKLEGDPNTFGFKMHYGPSMLKSGKLSPEEAQVIQMLVDAPMSQQWGLIQQLLVPIQVKLINFIAEAPGLIWHKYEGTVAGGGQNYIYVAGKQMKTTHFLARTPDEQDALIQAKN